MMPPRFAFAARKLSLTASSPDILSVGDQRKRKQEKDFDHEAHCHDRQKKTISTPNMDIAHPVRVIRPGMYALAGISVITHRKM